MLYLRRQWHRFQLARELLDEYEREERERIPFDKAVRLIESTRLSYSCSSLDSAARWVEAVREKAAQYQSNA